jgi:hypothetical protein
LSREELSSILEFLDSVPAGKATVTVGGHPFVSLDADEKALEIEMEGASEAGLRLSELARLDRGFMGVLSGPFRVASALSRLGWNLTMYAEGDKVLSMGKGESRLTGRISANPLRLRKLLKALK